VKARDASYDRLREETDLTANLVQEAIRRAVHAVDSGVDRWKKGKRTNKPEFSSWGMVYDKRSATFYRNKISLSTVNGRIECEFELPADSPTPYEEYVLSEEYEFRTSKLQYDQSTDAFYFHVKTRKGDKDGDAVEIEVSDDTGHQTVLGIDLVVASTGTFWSGDEYDDWIQEFEKRRAEMQQRGTQAAHNAVLRLGRREGACRK
jgi:hypothetical protein